MLQPFEKAPTGFAVCRALFDDGRMLRDFAMEDANPAFQRLLGLQPAETAQGLRAILTKLSLASQDWLEFLRSAAIGGHSIAMLLYVPAVGRSLQFDAYPCGRQRCVLQVTDVTEDMFSLYKLNSMLTAVDEYIFEYDGDYRCLSVFSSDGRFLGHDKEYYVGKTVRETMGGLWPMYENAFAETRDTRAKVRIEYEADTPEGVRWFGADILTISNLDGQERFYAAVNDITAVVEAGRDLTQENFKLSIINRLVQQVNSRMGIEQVIREIVDTIYSYYVEYRIGFVMLDEDNMLQFLYTRVPEGMPDITGQSVDMNAAPAYTDALRAHKPFVSDDVAADPRLRAMAARLQELQSAAFLHMPMRYPQRVAGALTMTNPSPHPWTPYEKELLREIAAIMELAIEKAFEEENRKRTEDVLSAEKERLRITLQCIGDGVIATDSQGIVTILNGVAETLTGWSAGEAQGHPSERVCPLSDENTGAALEDPVRRALAAAARAQLPENAMLRSRDGQHYAVSGSASPMLDAAGAVTGVVLVFRDVTEDKRRQREITYLSYHDALTGLYNRTFFDEELRRLNTDRQLPISVIMGDVNGLKLANDVFGHAEGDRVLITIARILTESTRSDDILARIGGDEFCVLLPKTSSAAAQSICRRILRRCREYAERADVITPPSISMGVATKTDAGQDIADTLKTAEQLMYKRKLLESKSVHNSILSAILSTLYEKSHEAQEHTARLAAHARAMGLSLGLTEEQLNDLELFSILHDIGKIAVDDRVLLKPGPLTDTEREEVRRHSETGYRVVRSSPEISHVADLILAHHEDWDGGGYPQGLRGEGIPLLARILRVADAYDAMTHDQPYRPALPQEQALRELREHAGKQFDPDIVRLFLDILEAEMQNP